MEPSPPSAWFAENLARLRRAAAGRPVADLACGRGRHALAAGAAGLAVVAVDRDPDFLRALAARAAGLPVHPLRTDLEAGHGIPVRTGSCGGILVFRFLFRPLAPAIAAALAPGGLLLYETFTTAQRELGRGPRNPDFLLRPGELPSLFPGLEIEDSWEGLTGGDPPEAVARLRARRPAG